MFQPPQFTNQFQGAGYAAVYDQPPRSAPSQNYQQDFYQPQVARPYSPGRLDVTNQINKTMNYPPVSGYTDVRARDQVDQSYHRPQTQTHSFDGSSTQERLQKFQSTRTNRLRPVVFQPNGSFKALKENGKLAVGPEDPAFAKGRGRHPEADTSYFIPGYTGFVRGAQHISGRTYGESTRRALNNDYREIVCTSPIPSAPQANRKIRQEEVPDSFVSHMFGDRPYHIPGYTGFVPGVRLTHAVPYGTATKQQLNENSQKYPRGPTNERQGFARTAIPRSMQSLSSNPVPGGSMTQQAPDMYIPASLRYLQFIPV